MDLTMTTAWLYLVWPLAIVLSVVGVDHFALNKNEFERILEEKHTLVYALFALGQFFGGGWCFAQGLSLLTSFGERPSHVLTQLIGLVFLDVGIVLLIRSVFGLRWLMRMWTYQKKME